MNIKLKVWDKKTNQMCKVGAVYFSDSFELDAISVHLPNGLVVIRSINDCIVMHSTGLKDLRNVEIFEGDIVWIIDKGEMDNGWGWFEEVKFSNGSFMVGDDSLVNASHRCVVHGNIYKCEDK